MAKKIEKEMVIKYKKYLEDTDKFPDWLLEGVKENDYESVKDKFLIEMEIMDVPLSFMTKCIFTHDKEGKLIK